LLANGKVLVAGGLGATGYLATAELYDPAAGTWAYTGSLATNRHRFSAVLLTNGQVLVMGGFTGPSGSVATATAELYNPATGTWTATGSMLTNRVCQSAKLLTNGQVLVTDGDFNGGKLAELYDPNSGTWSATGPMMASRIICSSTLLPSGKVLVAGGSGFSSSELYDPNSQTWTTITLTNAVAQTNGALQFNFAHATTTTNTVLCATNITLPLSNWTVLGTATETSFGQFQFTDAQATNHPQSFYRVRSP
jgi:hypothetical protein